MAGEKHSPVQIEGKREVTLNGRTITYIIERSSRAKCVWFRVRPRIGLRVVIPRSYDLQEIPALLMAKAGWILDKLAQCEQAPSLSARKELEAGDTIPYIGQDLVVIRGQEDRSNGSVKLERDRLVVSPRDGDGKLGPLVEQWLRQEASRLLRERVDQLALQMGVIYSRAFIRGQRSRWGSCSPRGNLSLNWRLVMAPQPVMDYVLIHELAHLMQLNHSKKFWELVASHCPQWRECRRWLKEHGPELAAKLTSPGDN